eukprot:TRINITY_DN42979_c0_g1_i1.p1 TRINITY_DN42979_c0_g1~~TRINITY_DN42979_c0_g1_i1.p1  ORF type:complete len:903 (+),score=283.24 TRINITY_DN42979_c0_g1_i1:47-2755(+)
MVDGRGATSPPKAVARLHDASRKAKGHEVDATLTHLNADRLAGDWRFSGSLVDSGGRGLTAEHSKQHVTYVPGVDGGAVRLNGVDECLRLPASAAVVPSDGGVSLSALFRCVRPHCSDEGDQGGALIVTQSSDNGRPWAPRFAIGLRGDGRSVSCWWRESAETAGRFTPQLDYSCQYFDGEWHHLCAVYDPSVRTDGRVRLWYDGKLVAETRGELVLAASGSHPLLIGACKPRHAPPWRKAAASADVGVAGAQLQLAVDAASSKKAVLQVDEGFFCGDIDRASIWARALSDAEVQDIGAPVLKCQGRTPSDEMQFTQWLYGRVAALEAELVCRRQSDALQLSHGLAGSWPLHGSIEDGSGRGMHGCVVSEAFYTGGPNGGALSLDGLTNFVFLPSSCQLLPGRVSFTAACFFRVPPLMPDPGGDPAPGSRRRRMSLLTLMGEETEERRGAAAMKLGLGLTEAGLLCASYRTGSEAGGELIGAGVRAADGRWHHAACSYDASELSLTLYLDGAQVGRTVAGYLVPCGPAQALLAAATPTAHSGSKAGSDSGRSQLFGGEMAEVRLYSTVFAPHQIGILAALRQDGGRSRSKRGPQEQWTAKAPRKVFMRVEDRLNPEHDAPAPLPNRIATLSQENGWLLDRLSLAEDTIRQLSQSVDTLTVKLERVCGNPIRDRRLLQFNGHSSFWGLPRGIPELNEAMVVPGSFTLEGWLAPERGGGAVFDRPHTADGGLGKRYLDTSVSGGCDVDVRDNTWLRVGLGVACCTKDTRLSVWHPQASLRLSNRQLPLLRWTHFAVVWCAEQSVLLLYIDGAEDTRCSDWRPALSNVFDGPVLVGRDALRRFYCGRMRDLRLWNRAVTGPALVRAMEHSDLSDDVGLLVQWPCDGDAQGAKCLAAPRAPCHWYP